MLKKLLIFINCLIILAALLVTCFPKIFWSVHNHNTEKLQAPLMTGKNDIEFEYGQDEKLEVEELQVDAENSGATEYLFLYPAELKNSKKQYPVVVWGNGTENTYENYKAGLKSLASYGFVVVGCDDSNMGDGKTLYEMALYTKSLNEEKKSIFYHKLDVEAIGASGHSQGACGAVNATTKYEESATLFKSLYTTSMPKLEMCVDKKYMEFAYWKYDISKVTIPYFATTGTLFLDSLWISPLESMQENFAKLSSDTPAFMARQIGANHNIVNEYHGSGYFNAWFCWTLKGDKEAAQTFIGKKEMKNNTTRWKDFQMRGDTKTLEKR